MRPSRFSAAHRPRIAVTTGVAVGVGRVIEAVVNDFVGKGSPAVFAPHLRLPNVPGFSGEGSDPNDGDTVRVGSQRLQVVGIRGEHGSPRFSEGYD